MRRLSGPLLWCGGLFGCAAVIVGIYLATLGTTRRTFDHCLGPVFSPTHLGTCVVASGQDWILIGIITIMAGAAMATGALILGRRITSPA